MKLARMTGFWQGEQSAFFDVRVLNQQLDTAYSSNQRKWHGEPNDFSFNKPRTIKLEFNTDFSRTATANVIGKTKY